MLRGEDDLLSFWPLSQEPSAAERNPVLNWHQHWCFHIIQGTYALSINKIPDKKDIKFILAHRDTACYARDRIWSQ